MAETQKTRSGETTIDWAEKVKCRVNRLNVHPENADLPIIVNILADKSKGGGRRVFNPGQVVELTRAQIESLRNAVEETDFPLSDQSGIHESKDPLQMAKNLYPGLKPIRNPETGEIRMIRNRRNYSVEIL